MTFLFMPPADVRVETTTTTTTAVNHDNKVNGQVETRLCRRHVKVQCKTDRQELRKGTRSIAKERYTINHQQNYDAFNVCGKTR